MNWKRWNVVLVGKKPYHKIRLLQIEVLLNKDYFYHALIKIDQINQIWWKLTKIHLIWLTWSLIIRACMYVESNAYSTKHITDNLLETVFRCKGITESLKNVKVKSSMVAPPTLHRAVPPKLHVLHSATLATNHKTCCTRWGSNNATIGMPDQRTACAATQGSGLATCAATHYLRVVCFFHKMFL